MLVSTSFLDVLIVQFNKRKISKSFGRFDTFECKLPQVDGRAAIVILNCDTVALTPF